MTITLTFWEVHVPYYTICNIAHYILHITYCTLHTHVPPGSLRFSASPVVFMFDIVFVCVCVYVCVSQASRGAGLQLYIVMLSIHVYIVIYSLSRWLFEKFMSHIIQYVILHTIYYILHIAHYTHMFHLGHSVSLRHRSSSCLISCLCVCVCMCVCPKRREEQGCSCI